MSLRRVISGALVLSVAAVGLLGCSNGQSTVPGGNFPAVPGGDPVTSEPVDSGASEVEDPGDETPEVDIASVEPVLAYDYEDARGYSYTLQLDSAKVRASIDVANARPGMANIEWDVQYEVEVFNTTPERNAPYPNQLFRLHLIPFWALDSPVCDHAASSNSFLTTLEVGEDGVARPFAEDQIIGEWCGLGYNPYRASGNLSILQPINIGWPGELTIPLDSSVTERRALTTGATIVVPEDQAEGALESFLAPAGWAIFGGMDDLNRARYYEHTYNCALGNMPLRAASFDIGCETINK